MKNRSLFSHFAPFAAFNFISPSKLLFVGGEQQKAQPEAVDTPKDKPEVSKEAVVKALRDRTGEIRRRIARLEAKKDDPQYPKFAERVGKLKGQLDRVRSVLDKVSKDKLELNDATVAKIERMTKRSVKPAEYVVTHTGTELGPDGKPVAKYEGQEVTFGGKGRMSEAQLRQGLIDGGSTPEEADRQLAEAKGQKPVEVAGDAFGEKDIAKAKQALEAIGGRLFAASKEYEDTVKDLPQTSEMRYDLFRKFYTKAAGEFASLNQYDKMLQGFKGVPDSIPLKIADMTVNARPGSLERNFRGMVLTPLTVADVGYFSEKGVYKSMIASADSSAQDVVARNMQKAPATDQAVDKAPGSGPVARAPGHGGAPILGQSAQ